MSRVRYIHRPAEEFYPPTSWVIADTKTVVFIAREARRRGHEVFTGRLRKAYYCQIQQPKGEVFDIVRRAQIEMAAEDMRMEP